MKNNKLLKGLLITLIAAYPLNTYAATKKETVFTNLNTNGSVVDTTVTNYVCAITKEQYEDDTRLKEIVNLNGNETFTQDGDKITWKVNGKDIYYQGNTDEEQPINDLVLFFDTTTTKYPIDQSWRYIAMDWFDTVCGCNIWEM